MIKWVRIVTFISALAFVGMGVFVLDAEEELNLAYRAYKQGDMDQAMRHARRTSFAAGNDKKVIERALKIEYAIAVRLGYSEKAMAFLGQAISLQPACGICYLRRGDLEYKQQNYAAALHDFEKGFKNAGLLKPMIGSYYHARQGLAHLAIGEIQKAQVDSQKARQFDSGSALAFFLESKVRDSQDDLDGAYSNARKAYLLGQKKIGFFSSPEGDLWLKYYSNVMIRYSGAHR